MNARNPFPSVGSIVHFIDNQAAHRAAIVIHCNGDDARLVWLRVLLINRNDYEDHWINQGDVRGTWHWPEEAA